MTAANTGCSFASIHDTLIVSGNLLYGRGDAGRSRELIEYQRVARRSQQAHRHRGTPDVRDFLRIAVSFRHFTSVTGPSHSYHDLSKDLLSCTIAKEVKIMRIAQVTAASAASMLARATCRLPTRIQLQCRCASPTHTSTTWPAGDRV